jgi:hypothetical protein
MNKYEKNPAFSKEERNLKLERDKKFISFREIVLNNKNYALGQAREILTELKPEEAQKLFEMFQEREGALPDNLAMEYIKLVYGPENLQAKTDEGLNFYEAVSEIASEIKAAQIHLDQELVNKQIKMSQEIIEKE